MELTKRKVDILRAIIEDFITTAEPVGSRSISRRHELGISPATIRNEMADLEDMGLLTHPHTSAGRIPSETAYRLYVNQIMGKYVLTPSEKKVIRERLNENLTELDSAIEKAANILAEITNLTAFGITPNKESDKLKYIKLVPLDGYSVLMMIVADSGKVSNTTLKIEVPYTDESLEILSKSLTYTFKGMTLTEALRHDIIENIETDIQALSKLAENVMPNFMKTLEDMLDVSVYVDGLTKIFTIPEYSDMDKAKTLMEVLDRKRELASCINCRDDGVAITIGEENPHDELKDYSLITATYHIDGMLVGKLGVIGPTRMKYREISSVIEYLSDNISRSFGITGGNDVEEQRED